MATPQFPRPIPEDEQDLISFLLQHKLAELSGSSDPRDYILALYTQFWAKPEAVQPQTWTLKGKFTALNWTENKLFIFDEYPTIARELVAKWTALRESAPYHRRGLLLAGSPGIGKTSCLLYILGLALSQKIPTILVYEDRTSFFTSQGVYDITAEISSKLSMFLSRTSMESVLVLVDMFWAPNSMPEPTGSFLRVQGPSFTVVAASPRQEYKPWVKMSHATCHVVSPPSPSEIERLLSLTLSSLTYEQVSEIVETCGVNFPALHDATASSTNYDVLIDDLMDLIKNTVQALTTDILQDLFRSEDTLNRYQASHILLTTLPKKRTKPQLSVLIREKSDWLVDSLRSRTVLRYLVTADAVRQLEKHRGILIYFQSSIALSPAVDLTFEYLCHDYILSARRLSLVRLELAKNRGKSRWTIPLEPVSLDIDIMHTGLVYSNRSPADSTRRRDKYYVPREPNNPSFDSFLITSDGRGFGFQMTIGKTHNVKAEGLKVLKNRLNSSVKPALVYVVPEGVEFYLPNTQPKWNLDDFELYAMRVNFSKIYSHLDLDASHFLEDEKEISMEPEEDEVEPDGDELRSV